jgi:ubiquinone biosynthesis protein UbiJ
MIAANTRSYRTPLPGLLASSMEAAINRLLAADENSGERLGKLDGRRVRLQLEDLAITLDFVFTRYQVKVSLDTEAEANTPEVDSPQIDTLISGSMPALFAMAMPDEDGRWGGPGSRVKISGDATLARDVERLFSKLDPDWEAGLARYTGDVLGHQLATGIKGFAAALKSTGGNLQQMAAEYLLSEQSPLAQPQEQRSFNDEVDRLRDATDRLEARVRILAEKQAGSGQDSGKHSGQDSGQDEQS